ncbi:MAG: L-lactate dehydrogenase [Acidobacteriota bacterium]
MNRAHYPFRVAVVGTGRVGSTFAYALLLRGLVSEIILIDKDKAKAEGEAMDLSQTVPFTHPTQIRVGEYKDCEQAAVIVIAAGVHPQKGESLLDAIKRNVSLMREVVPQICRYNKDAVLLVATQPVDLMTYAAYKISRRAAHKVCGFGTLADTARLRELLGIHYGIAPHNIHAYIIGEQGKGEVPVWSLANITSMQLKDFCFTNGIDYDQKALDDLFRRARDESYQIIERKGALYFAVGAGLLGIVEAILKNQKQVFCVSSLIENYYGISDVCLSLPAVIGTNGVEKVLRLELNHQEIAGLRQSAEFLKANLAKLALEAR